MYTADGLGAARDVALTHAVALLRDASRGGLAVADEGAVGAAAAAAARAAPAALAPVLVLAMTYAPDGHREPASAAPSRAPPPVACFAGGADRGHVRRALQAEGIRATARAVTEALRESAALIGRDVERRLAARHPRRRWTAPQVLAAARGR